MIAFPMTPSGVDLYNKNKDAFQEIHKRARLPGVGGSLKATVASIATIATSIITKAQFTSDDPYVLYDFGKDAYIKQLMGDFNVKELLLRKMGTALRIYLITDGGKKDLGGAW
ncbi:hypothetical protein BGZ90_002003 [Linnemannia elongata]|nr:hypothetical protein BGZ90_002003 [Linnemannia elongata]